MLAIIRKKIPFCFFTLCFLSLPSFANHGHYYVGGSLGDSFTRLSNSSLQISYESGTLITDDYPLDNSSTSAAVFSVNGGYEFAGQNWQPAIALGLGVYGNPADAYYNGYVTETAEGDPGSTLYKYTFNVSSTRVMAEVQFTWALGKFAPFINLGAGPVWNKMNNYTEVAVTDDGYPPQPAFQAHTNVNLSYQAGLGISTAFNFAGSQTAFAQERLALGYRYANFGTTAFGTRGVNYPYQLKTGSLAANEVYLSYTHLF